MVVHPEGGLQIGHLLKVHLKEWGHQISSLMVEGLFEVEDHHGID